MDFPALFALLSLVNIMGYSTLAAFIPLIPVAAAAIGPVAQLPIVNKVIAPDGFERSTVLAGGVHPGPLIRAIKGQRLKLNVVDQLTDNTMLKTTSIHWHGFLQKGTTYADGAAFVSQCPIVPNHSFEYNFQADQGGTFWYHSHHRTQYCDGLRGAIVVYDLLDPHRLRYDVDNEDTVITLADWYHLPAPSAGPVGRPVATLINGKGRYVGGPPVDLAVVNVVKGLRYRFRLVSLSCDPNFIFSIDKHKFTIIEVDGVNHQPVEVDSLTIFAGQRYSIVMKADQPIGNYWIRANPNLGSLGFEGGLNSAILRYALAAKKEPTPSTPPVPVKPLAEGSLVPLSNPGAPGTPEPGKADVNINLALSFNGNEFLVNGAPFKTPSLPVLTQILSGAHTPQELLPPGSVYVLPRNKVVELSIPAAGAVGGPHPFHLHGHVFDVVRVAGSSSFNFKNPVRRDVVSIGAGTDNVTIRFRTDNPGPWILHCHIDWHLDLGLAVVFAEAPEDVAQFNDPIPQSWNELCPLYNETGIERLDTQRARPLSPELLTPA